MAPPLTLVFEEEGMTIMKLLVTSLRTGTRQNDGSRTSIEDHLAQRLLNHVRAVWPAMIALELPRFPSELRTAAPDTDLAASMAVTSSKNRQDRTMTHQDSVNLKRVTTASAASTAEAPPKLRWRLRRYAGE